MNKKYTKIGGVVGIVSLAFGLLFGSYIAPQAQVAEAQNTPTEITLPIKIIPQIEIIGQDGETVLGGLVNIGQRDFPDGISVDGTERISGTGVFKLAGNTVNAGASAAITQTAATSTLTAAQICDNSVITLTAGITNVSTSLPSVADLTADCFTTDGDYKKVLIKSGSASASYIQFLSDAGGAIDVQNTGSGDETISQNQAAILELWRTSSTAFTVEIHESTTAD